MARTFDCKWLVLVPTPFELDQIRDQHSSLFERPDTVVELCGFGPIVSAAKSSELILRYRPQRVLLLGIAGSYNERLALGRAFSFRRVACFGVGTGFGPTHQSASSAGWLQWQENRKNCIGEILDLDPAIAAEAQDTIVTATCSAASPQDVAQRIRFFERAEAEDMEGFAVAVACKLANLRLTIVRGISNQAGDRDKSNWCVGKAISAATSLAETIIRQREQLP